MDPLAVDKRRENFLSRQHDQAAQIGEGNRFFLTQAAADVRYVLHQVSDANVSSPPTEAELIGIFGDPASLPASFCGLVDDNGAGTAVWLVRAINSQFWYEQLTAAV